MTNREKIDRLIAGIKKHNGMVEARTAEWTAQPFSIETMRHVEKQAKALGCYVCHDCHALIAVKPTTISGNDLMRITNRGRCYPCWKRGGAK